MDFVDLGIRFRGKVLVEDMLPWNVYQVQISKPAFGGPLVPTWLNSLTCEFDRNEKCNRHRTLQGDLDQIG